MEKQRNWSIQNSRSCRISKALGNPKEPPLYELRQNVARITILLPRQYSAKSSRGKTLLPVSICNLITPHSSVFTFLYRYLTILFLLQVPQESYRIKKH